MRELRPYQSISIDKLAHKASLGKKRIIFQLATGGGKTVTFAGLVNRFLAKQQRKVLILVNRGELLKQAYSTLFEWYSITAAPITAGVNYLPNLMVYVAMVETAYNRLKRNPNYFGNIGLVIVDECHIGNFKKLYDYFPDSLIIGFTATPISGSKKDPLKNHFEDIVCGIDIPDLIANGSLVPNKTIHIKNIQRNELRIKNGEFDEVQMANIYSSSKHVQNTIKAYQQFALNTKTIVFNCNIDHSKKVNEAFQAFGYPSRHLDGNTDERERQETLLWFKNTPNAILNNVGILTTGFDEPSILTVIVNKSTMSVPLWLQMTGRGSRPYKGKDFFYIIDMGGNAITHGDWNVPRDWKDIFFNPDKPKMGGEAPSKECVGCSVVIHASVKICKYCGANNAKAPVYDGAMVKFELLSSKKPIDINVAQLITEQNGKTTKDGKPFKEMSVLHSIKYRIITHASRIWRLKKIDDKTAYKLVDIYQQKVKEWCELKQKSYSQWYRETPRQWFIEELKKAFDWKSENVVV